MCINYQVQRNGQVNPLRVLRESHRGYLYRAIDDGLASPSDLERGWDISGITLLFRSNDREPYPSPVSQAVMPSDRCAILLPR